MVFLWPCLSVGWPWAAVSTVVSVLVSTEGWKVASHSCSSAHAQSPAPGDMSEKEHRPPGSGCPEGGDTGTEDRVRGKTWHQVQGGQATPVLSPGLGQELLHVGCPRSRKHKAFVSLAADGEGDPGAALQEVPRGSWLWVSPGRRVTEGSLSCGAS